MGTATTARRHLRLLTFALLRRDALFRARAPRAYATDALPTIRRRKIAETLFAAPSLPPLLRNAFKRVANKLRILRDFFAPKANKNNFFFSFVKAERLSRDDAS